MDKYKQTDLVKLCKDNGLGSCYGTKKKLFDKLVEAKVLTKTGKISKVSPRRKRKTSPKKRSPKGKQKTCLPGTILNQYTQRCVKIDGPTYKKITSKIKK